MREYIKTTKSGKSLIHEFRSVSDFISTVQDDRTGKYNSSTWAGGLSKSSSIKMAREGWREHVPAIEKLMNEIDDASVPVEQLQWQNSVAGYLPNVPAFLSGEPENMMRLSESESEVGPVKIMVSTYVSSSLSASKMRQRASAILALVAKIAQMRPTELWLYGEGGSDTANEHCTPLIRVDTAPLDVSSASFVLAHPAFTRSLMYGYSRSNMGFNGHWAFDATGEAEREIIMREVFDLSDNDILLVGGFSGDGSIADPVTWVNEQLEKFNQSAIV